MNFSKIPKEKRINAEGVFYYKTVQKFIVRVKVGKYFTTLMSFIKEEDAIDYYKKWLKENRKSKPAKL